MKTDVKLYKVIKIFRDSGNRKTLERNLTIDQARRIVQAFPNNDKHMVVFTEQ